MKSLQAGSQQAGFGHAYPSPSVSQASEIFLWQTSGFTQEPAELICSGTEKGQVKSRANNNPKPEAGKGQASTSTLSIQLEKQNLGRGLQRITKILGEGLFCLPDVTWTVPRTFTETYCLKP